MIDTVSHGYGILTEVPLSPILPLAPKNIPLIPSDPDKARALLDQAGWEVGRDGVRVKDGRRLVLQFPYVTGSPDADERVELIREHLRAVGIDLQTRKVAAAEFFGLYQDGGTVYSGKFDMTFFSWGTGPGADISSLFSCDQIPPKGQNDLRYCNREVVEPLLQAYKATYDENEQRQIVDKEIRQIIADVPTIVLGVAKEGFAYNTNLKNYTPGNITNFDDMMNVDI
jgi:peptide/nickel transport system substrate-binding protein